MINYLDIDYFDITYGINSPGFQKIHDMTQYIIDLQLSDVHEVAAE